LASITWISLPMLLRHAHDQLFQILVNLGSSKGVTLFGTVTRLGHKLPVPGEDGVRLDHTGDSFQHLLPNLFANLRKCFALCIGQSHAALDLAAQETILCHQVFNAEQEFLVYGTCDVHEELLPIHMLFTLRLFCLYRW